MGCIEMAWLFLFYQKKKIPIYTLGYPKGLAYCINQNKKIINYEDIIQIKKFNNKQINKDSYYLGCLSILS